MTTPTKTNGKKLFNIISTALAVIGLLGFVVVQYILPQQTASADSLLQPDNAEIVAQGERIYQAQCASCHGVNLEGEENWRQRNSLGMLPAPPHDPSGHTWHHPDAQLVELTKYGPGQMIEGYVSAMPAYEGVLSDEEIIAVLSFIKSTWPEEIRQKHDQINQSAREQALSS